jgi:pyruvate formate lyase activating enzyme
MIDIFKKTNCINTLVSNGYSTRKTNDQLIKNGLNAVNQDIKAMNDEFYENYCGATLQPVLDTAKQYKRNGLHLEITHLVIDKYFKENDVRDLCYWVKNELGMNTPIHFHQFRNRGLTKIKSTHLNTLKKCLNIAKEVGLNYPYIQNIRYDVGTTTYCPQCHHILIKRIGWSMIKNNISDKKCKYCGYDLSNDIIGEINNHRNNSKYIKKARKNKRNMRKWGYA